MRKLFLYRMRDCPDMFGSLQARCTSTDSVAILLDVAQQQTLSFRSLWWQAKHPFSIKITHGAIGSLL